MTKIFKKIGNFFVQKKPSPEWIFWVTALEYFAWGFVDPIYSLFVADIVGNFFVVGLIFGLRSFLSLLSVFFFNRFFQDLPPFQGLFVSHIGYILVAFGFFLAGYLHSTLLVLIIAGLNGIVLMMNQSSKQIFLIENTNTENASQILGKNAAAKYSFWAIGMLFGGIFLLCTPFIFSSSHLSFFWLYFFVGILLLLQSFLFIPFRKSFVDLPWQRLDDDAKKVIREDKIFLHLFAKMKKFPSELNFAIALFFFLELTFRAVLLFIPILGKGEGLSIPQIFFLTAFMLLPMLFTFFFSHFADKHDRFLIVIFGIFLSFFPLVFLSYTTVPLYIAIFSAIISFALAMLQPAALGINASLAPAFEKKTVTQLELFFSTLGAVVGGMGIGAIAQIFGIQTAFLCIAGMSIVFLCFGIFVKFNIKKEINEEKQHERKIFEHTHFHFRRSFS